tara:strand:+ start:784 stop:1416 length:633 start_codon:yes stop_codon:yes gene_type:complete
MPLQTKFFDGRIKVTAGNVFDVKPGDRVTVPIHLSMIPRPGGEHTAHVGVLSLYGGFFVDPEYMTDLQLSAGVHLAPLLETREVEGFKNIVGIDTPDGRFAFGSNWVDPLESSTLKHVLNLSFTVPAEAAPKVLRIRFWDRDHGERHGGIFASGWTANQTIDGFVHIEKAADPLLIVTTQNDSVFGMSAEFSADVKQLAFGSNVIWKKGN